MAEERQEHNLKMKKMEAEMEQVFEMKVKEKKQKLKDSEADVSWAEVMVTVAVRSRCKLGRSNGDCVTVILLDMTRPLLGYKDGLLLNWILLTMWCRLSCS